MFDDNEKFDIKKLYGYSQKSIEYLGDKDKLFWDYINLSVYTDEIIEKCKKLRYKPYSLNILFYNFVNHIVVAYRLLTENMEQEYFVMLRQCYEVLWLQKYFVKYPKKEKDWVLRKFKPSEYKRIENWMIRDAFPAEKKYMDIMYSRLSDFVHCNFKAFSGVGLGGFYDKYILDNGFST